jgi:hypothetical protein
MPGERRVRLLDSESRQFTESPKTKVLLAAHRLRSSPPHTPLRPGESYDSFLVFETLREAHAFRLLVTSAEDLDAAIGGHEISRSTERPTSPCAARRRQIPKRQQTRRSQTT